MTSPWNDSKPCTTMEHTAMLTSWTNFRLKVMVGNVNIVWANGLSKKVILACFLFHHHPKWVMKHLYLSCFSVCFYLGSVKSRMKSLFQWSLLTGPPLAHQNNWVLINRTSHLHMLSSTYVIIYISYLLQYLHCPLSDHYHPQNPKTYQSHIEPNHSAS